MVADGPGLEAANTLPFAVGLKAYRQAAPNIARARNIGIRAAAGDVIAFLDDDAVPEPTWGRAILAAFEDPDLAAATGPVLGRNGISVQWGPLAVNGLAQDRPVDPDEPFTDGFVRKLQGTNMAFRRATLEDLGGFDEGFAFYLDDTDMALRVGRAGLRTRWVPGAVVHHGFAASVRRNAARVPLSLADIGTSSTLFLRKHAERAERATALHELEASQSARLLRLAKARKIDAHKMRTLMETLREGIKAGEDRDSIEPGIEPVQGIFEPLSNQPPPPTPRVLSGWPHQLARLRAQAADLVKSGQPVSLFCFGPTPRKHVVRFADGGWWEQTGGLYGPSDRDGPRLRFTTYHARLSAERSRISATRGL